MKKAFYLAGIAVVIILGLVSWFVLPETVAVQVGLNGEVSNTMPKLFALLIPAVISVIGGVIGIKRDAPNSKKGAALVVIGFVVMLITLIFNLSR